MGGGGVAEHRNTAKKIYAHRITARKVDETPPPSHTVIFEITATPQIEILFTASPHKMKSTPQHRKSPCSPHLYFFPTKLRAQELFIIV